MTCTFDDITRWLDEAMLRGATHLMVACDDFEHDNYPIFVLPGENAKELYDKVYGSNNMQHVDEVYNMSMDIDRQRREDRALNF